MFCPECGSILLPKKQNDKTTLCCRKCDYCSGETKAVISDKVKKKDQEVDVVEQDVEVHSKTEAKCPKCGNNEAYYWFKQTRASDEPATQFLKCTKCKHQWRNYD